MKNHSLIPHQPPLREHIASYVREQVMSGRLRTGESVNIEALARELGTSTTPVREALLALNGEGFVIVEPRRGFSVAPLSAHDLKDLYLVQGQLAGELASRAAVKATDADLERLDSIQERLEAAAEQPNAEIVQEMNAEFHRAINLYARSPKLAWLLNLVVSYFPRRGSYLVPGWVSATLNDHPIILATLRKRDSEGARKAMETHIRHTATLLVNHFGTQGISHESATEENGAALEKESKASV